MLSLLLLFAVSLNVIGAAMLASAHRQSVGISNEYVTIAVPPDRRQYTWEERENGMAKDEPSIPHYLAHETAMKSGFVEDVDYRYILGAEVMGSKAISSGYRNVMDYNAYFDNPCYNMAIFAVKCVKSEMPSTDKDATLILSPRLIIWLKQKLSMSFHSRTATLTFMIIPHWSMHMSTASRRIKLKQPSRLRQQCAYTERCLPPMGKSRFSKGGPI